MHWDMMVYTDRRFPGWLSNVQLCDFWTQHDNDPIYYATDQNHWLDGLDPYCGIEQFEVHNNIDGPTAMHHDDTPNIEPPIGQNFTSCVEYSGDFWTYARFQPDGGIRITLGSIHWTWHGKGSTDSNGLWLLNIDNTSVLEYLEDDTFPLWSHTYSGN
jgi:hypothetical protein